jgi:PBP1b-binding outer membrane lipoprotein LpoB
MNKIAAIALGLLLFAGCASQSPATDSSATDVGMVRSEQTDTVIHFQPHKSHPGHWHRHINRHHCQCCH